MSIFSAAAGTVSTEPVLAADNSVVVAIVVVVDVVVLEVVVLLGLDVVVVVDGFLLGRAFVGVSRYDVVM